MFYDSVYNFAIICSFRNFCPSDGSLMKNFLIIPYVH